MWDFDGSVSGLNVPTLIGSNLAWWNADDSCSYLVDNELWSCPWRFESWDIYRYGSGALDLAGGRGKVVLLV
jgi:hypothetical protein